MDVTALGSVTEAMEVPAKAPSPMRLTEWGIVTEARDEQPIKASNSMEMTLSGIDTDASDLQR